MHYSEKSLPETNGPACLQKEIASKLLEALIRQIWRTEASKEQGAVEMQRKHKVQKRKKYCMRCSFSKAGREVQSTLLVRRIEAGDISEFKRLFALAMTDSKP